MDFFPRATIVYLLFLVLLPTPIISVTTTSTSVPECSSDDRNNLYGLYIDGCVVLTCSKCGSYWRGKVIYVFRFLRSILTLSFAKMV